MIMIMIARRISSSNIELIKAHIEHSSMCARGVNLHHLQHYANFMLLYYVLNLFHNLPFIYLWMNEWWYGSDSLDSFIHSFVHSLFDEDGIQVDKMRQIVYNIPYEANAMITGPPPSATLMLSSGITFPLASSCWIIPGTLLCYMGCSWERGMRFGNMLVDRVGMGLISLFMWCVKYVKVQFRYLMCCWGVPAADDESRMDKKM